MSNIQILNSISNNNKYLKWYLSLVTRIWEDNYTEKHHILPKSLGGDNSKSNIVRLPARVHFICHMLLVRMVKDSIQRRKMAHALNMMCMSNHHQGSRYKATSRQAENARVRLSESMKGESNPMYGKPAHNRGVTHTPETKEKLSQANKEYLKLNPPQSLGLKRSDETRAKMRGPKSDEAKKKMSIAARNRHKLKCIYCGKECMPTNHNRWHGEKCKVRPSAE